MSNFKPETIELLKKEAKSMFNQLSGFEKAKLGSYRPILVQLKKSWKKGNKIDTENDSLDTVCQVCRQPLGCCDHKVKGTKNE